MPSFLWSRQYLIDCNFSNGKNDHFFRFDYKVKCLNLPLRWRGRVGLWIGLKHFLETRSCSWTISISWSSELLQTDWQLICFSESATCDLYKKKAITQRNGIHILTRNYQYIFSACPTVMCAIFSISLGLTSILVRKLPILTSNVQLWGIWNDSQQNANCS